MADKMADLKIALEGLSLAELRLLFRFAEFLKMRQEIAEFLARFGKGGLSDGGLSDG